jgi:hypothetical protein
LSGARACIGIALTSGPGPNSDAKERRRDNGDARHHSIISLLVGRSAARCACGSERASAPPTAERASVGTARFLTKSLSQSASQPACYLFISLSVLSARWPPANTQRGNSVHALAHSPSVLSVQGDAKGTNYNDTLSIDLVFHVRGIGSAILLKSRIFFKFHFL